MSNRDKEDEVIRQFTDVLIELGIYCTPDDIRQFLQEHPQELTVNDFVKKINIWMRERDFERIESLSRYVLTSTREMWLTDEFKRMTDYFELLLKRYYPKEEVTLILENLARLRIEKEWKPRDEKKN